MNHAKITGIGFHVPERVVTNQDLEKMLNQIVNLLISIEQRLSRIEKNTEDE